ncbi:hypothetical protein [Cohnella sp. 56]|uniref:hypothetical protein n=1 Tax=Cohnella sp. 56 TaxID=3113722 RepID=UPI0030E761B3
MNRLIKSVVSVLTLVSFALPGLASATTFSSTQHEYVSISGTPIHLSSNYSPEEINDIIKSINQKEIELSNTPDGKAMIDNATQQRITNQKNGLAACSEAKVSGGVTTQDTDGVPPLYCPYIYSYTEEALGTTYAYPYFKEILKTYQINQTNTAQGLNFTATTTNTITYSGSVSLSKLATLGLSFTEQQSNSYSNVVSVPAHSRINLYEQSNWTHKEGWVKTIFHSYTVCGWYVYDSAAGPQNWSMETPGAIGYRLGTPTAA